MTELYLIWSNEHRAWWRPDRCGYTLHIEAAGRYGRIEGREICTGANIPFCHNTLPNEIMVLESDAIETMQATEGTR